MALQALQNQRRAEQMVHVTFNDRPKGTPAGSGTPQRPEDILGQNLAEDGRPDKGEPD
jgi:hypothetical protein